MKNIALLLILLAISSHLHSQETRYIRDELYVPLRSGQTNQHRIVHKGLVSGTAVSIIKTSDDQEYTMVRTRGGTEGWIQTQYLSTEPAGRDLYLAANEKLIKVQQQNAQLTQQLNAIRNKEKEARKNLSALSSESEELSEELTEIKEISANALQLNNDNQELSEENHMLKKQLELLTTDNQRLKDEKQSDDFLNGAFAVLIGVMITLLIPRLWPQKRTDWA